MNKVWIFAALSLTIFLNLSYSQTLAWTQPGVVSDIQYYPGDGAAKLPAVKVGLNGASYVITVNSDQGKQIFSSISQAFTSGIRVRFWASSTAIPNKPEFYEGYHIQRNPGDWIYMNQAGLKIFALIVQK